MLRSVEAVFYSRTAQLQSVFLQRVVRTDNHTVYLSKNVQGSQGFHVCLGSSTFLDVAATQPRVSPCLCNVTSHISRQQMTNADNLPRVHVVFRITHVPPMDLSTTRIMSTREGGVSYPLHSPSMSLCA